MAITAKFQADFSSFLEAVQRAEVQLRSFDAGAGRVEKSLARMVDNFSGRKLIQDATLMAEAVDRVGGASALTESEIRRVAAATNDAAAKLKLLGQEVPPGLQKIATESQKAVNAMKPPAGGFFGDLTGEIGRIAAGFISAQAIIGGVSTAFRTLTEFVGDSITAFSESEAAGKRLEGALRAQGTATPDVIRKFRALSEQFQETTVFSDDLLTEMQALLVQVGHVLPSEMDGALRASADLAAGLGIDLRQATMLVAKAMGTGGEEIGRLKALLGDAAPAGEKLTDVLDAINSQFGGQASAQVETYAGKVEQLANQFNNLQEQIGELIVTNPIVIAGMRTLVRVLEDLQDPTSRVRTAFGFMVDAFNAMQPGLRMTAALLGSWAVRADEAAEATRKWNKFREDITSAAINLSKETKEMRAQEAQLRASADARRRHADAMKEQEAAAKKLAAEHQRLYEREQELAEGFWRAVMPLPGFIAQLTYLDTAFEPLPGAIDAVTKDLGAFERSLVSAFKVGNLPTTVLPKLESLVAPLQRVEKILQGIQTDFAQMAVVGIRAFDQIEQVINSTASAGQKFTGVITSALSALASMAGDTKTGGALSGAAAGAGIGSLFGPWGTAIGAGVGALAGLFGPGEVKKINDMRDAFIDVANGGLGALNQKAHEAGMTLDALLQADTVTEYVAAIRDLTDAFNFQSEAMTFLDDTVKKYGFSISELGPTLSKQKLDEQAALLTKEFYALEAAGLNVETITGKMSDALNEYVKNALATGAEVPAALKPILHQLAVMGLLTDQDGNKIEDLEQSGLKFSDTMAEATRDLIDEIKKLVEAIERGLGTALKNLPSRVPIVIDVEYDISPPPGLPPELELPPGVAPFVAPQPLRVAPAALSPSDGGGRDRVTDSNIGAIIARAIDRQSERMFLMLRDALAQGAR